MMQNIKLHHLPGSHHEHPMETYNHIRSRIAEDPQPVRECIHKPKSIPLFEIMIIAVIAMIFLYRGCDVEPETQSQTSRISQSSHMSSQQKTTMADTKSGTDSSLQSGKSRRTHVENLQMPVLSGLASHQTGSAL